MKTRLSEELGLEYPIFAFSKAPEVVAAVTRAGGMGVLGAVAYNTDQLRQSLDWISENVDGKPFGLDVVMPARHAGTGQDVEMTEEMFLGMISDEHKAFVADMLARYGVPELPADVPRWQSMLSWTEEVSRPQVDLGFEYPIKLLANALGSPPKDIVDQAHTRGIKVAALCGSVKHARKHIETGVDIIVAQGTEAGGHCGEVATMVLIPEVVDAVAPAPVLAAGGIGDGRQIAAALALGAEGAWLGSVWLTAQESDVPRVLQDKLLRATSSDTVRSRALTGKPARQLKTAWSQEWDDPKNPRPLMIPLQFMLNNEATTRIYHFASDPSTRAHELLTSPVGQIVGRMNEIKPVAKIMETLVSEYASAMERLTKIGV